MTMVTRGLGGGAGTGTQTVAQLPISGVAVTPRLRGTLSIPALSGVARQPILTGSASSPRMTGRARQPRLAGAIEGCNIFRSFYPPLDGATEVWHFGKATGDYTSEILGDLYVAGKTGSSNILYDELGPTDTDMRAVYLNNDGTFVSHFTSPGIDGGGNSSGPVNAAMKPGTSSFQLFFGMMSVSPQPSLTNYYFFDYDIQDASSPFKKGIQIFVSTVGIFAPTSLVILIFDDNGAFHESKAVLPSGLLFNDNLWHHVKLVFDRSATLPSCIIDEINYPMSLVFGSSLAALGPINPVNGIRFGMREFSESAVGRANMKICAAAYAKNLTYDWLYWA